MKQLLFMFGSALLGTVGSFLLSPVYGFAVYYMYAILRPEVLWDWILPTGYRWSFIVAIVTMLATVGWKLGIFAPLLAGARPWYGEPRWTRIHYLFLGFVAWICLTYFTARHPEKSYLFFVEYVKIFVMFVAATFALRTVRDLWVIYYVITLTTLYVAYEVNIYYFIDKVMFLQARGIAGLDNNGAALLFAMVIPLCYFAWESGRNLFRWGFLLGIPFLLHAIMLSFSRGAMLTAGVAGMLIFLRSRNKKFLGILYSLAFIMILATAGKEVRERFMSINKTEADESAQSRLTTWKIAFRMMSEEPVFGFGIRNSVLYTKSYGADIEGRAIHSQYLQTGADSGIVALVLYIALLVSVVRGLQKVRRDLRPWNDPETERVRGMCSGLECGVICFSFGAFFLSLEHFEMPYILMLLSLQLYAITKAIYAHMDPAFVAQLQAPQFAPNPRTRFGPTFQPVAS